MSDQDKIRPLRDYRKTETSEQYAAVEEEVKLRSGRDTGKVAIFIAILSVMLLVVLFFGLNQNIAGLSNEVRSLGLMREEISNINSKVENLQTTLADVPEQTRRMMLANELRDISRRLELVSGQISENEHSTAILNARRAVDQVLESMEQ